MQPPLGSMSVSAVQRLLDRLAGRKGQLLLRRDLDRRAGCRIASLALRSVLQLELSKRGDLRFRASKRRVGDLFEDAFNNRLGPRLGQVLFGCDLIGDFVGRGHMRTSSYCFGPSALTMKMWRRKG